MNNDYRKNKKTDGINKPVELHKSFFYRKILTGIIFLLAIAGNHTCYKLIFYSLRESVACCYFGADLGNRFDHYSLSRLTDGTPHSSSDLLYFTLLLPFTWTIFFKSKSLSLFRLFWMKFFSVQNLFPLLLGQKHAKANLNSAKFF